MTGNRLKTLPEYIVIDTGDRSKSRKIWIPKMLAQIPKGKVIVLTDEILNLPQNEIIVKVINPEDIPKITRRRD